MNQKPINKIKIGNNNHEPIFIYICISVSFILCAILRFSLIIESYLKSIIITALFFVPTLFSFLLLLIKKRKNIKNGIINFVQIIFILIFSMYMFIIIIIGSFVMATDGVNNIKNYKKVKSSYKISIAPNNIPKNVKDVNFHYNNSFLQGGEIFYLYFKTDHRTIQKYKEKYEDTVKWINEYNSLDSSYYYLKSNYIDNLFMKSKEGLKIYYLEGYCDDSGYCNHGEYNIVIIDESSNSIMFNYEKW